MTLDLSRNTVPAFITPVVNYLWQDSEQLNAELAELILAAEANEAGLYKSNVGGWHSAMDFLSRPEAPLVALRERFESFTAALLQQFVQPDTAPPGCRLEGWANVLRHGGYNSVHCHPNADWSIVYFVTGNPPVADHPFSGKLELLDPRPGAGLVYTENSSLYGRFLVNPHPGQMLAFPAWLQHQVHTCFGQAPRISVAINVNASSVAGIQASENRTS